MCNRTLKLRLLLSGLLLLAFSGLFAQDARTMLQFEDAEKAFNAGNYEETLKQLDEVEKQTGVTSKTLYLRIVSEHNLFDGGTRLYDDKKEFDRLQRLRNNAEKYLKALSQQGIDDKYREIYGISESLQQFPKNEQEWLDAVKLKQQKAQQLKEEAELELYNSVVQQRTEEQAQLYLKKYPKGRYKAEVEKLYEESFYAKALQLLDGGYYSAARIKLQAYKDQFPRGEQIAVVDQKIAQADMKIQEQRLHNIRDRIDAYVLASYATDGNIGLEIGSMSTTQRVKMLLSLEGKNPFKVLQTPETETIASTAGLEDMINEYYKEVFLTVTVGANIRISYPIWAYVAAGVRESRLMAKKTVGESFKKGNTYKVEDPKSTQYFPELGLGARIHNRIAGKVGVRLINGETIFRVGAGIVF